MPFLRCTNPQIDWNTHVIKFSNGNRIQAVLVAPGDSRPSLFEISAKAAVQLARQKGSTSWFAFIRDPSNVQTGLLASTMESSDPIVAAAPRLRALYDQYSDVFSESHPGQPAPGQVTHRIDRLDELSMPPRSRAYKMSPAKIAEAHRQVDQILEKGWIHPSTSPYGAPLQFVHKKMGELRMCIDYRIFNKQSRLDQFPIPRIEDLLDKLANATVFSKLNPSNAYHQVPIEEGHQYKTAVQTSFGLYEWVVLPWGLCNAPATFQCLMHNIFPSCQNDFVIVYLHDILVFSQDQEQHLAHVTYVLDQLRKHGLKAKQKNTFFCLDHVEYLGHIVQNGTVRADPSKAAAVAEWPVPSDVKQLQRFLGLSNYYNRFIHQFAHIAALLTSLLQKHVPFTWGPQQQSAFDELKLLFTAIPVLQITNFEYDFVLKTDASTSTVGAVLMQDKDDGMQPVAYFNKILLDTKTRYAPHQVELLAIVMAFEKFRPYVECHHTIVKTDYKPLIHVKTQPHLSNRQIHQTQKLGWYNYTVKYKKGITNVTADVLGICPDLQGKKSKFVHFSDQRVFPLVQSHVFDQNIVVQTSFEWSVRPPSTYITDSTKITISTLIDVPEP